MNWTHIAAIVCLFVSGASESRLAAASTPSPAPPIQLSVCRATITPETRALELRFADVGPVAARAVAFTVQVGTWRTEIRDAGTFSPGAMIDHSFRLDIDEFPWTVFKRPVPRAECAVERVELVDGTHWSDAR